MSNVSNTLKGLAGEYYVAAELSRRNILALVTPKNNPLFDILATDPNGTKSVAIQVKTMGLDNDQGWKIGMDITMPRNNKNLFVVLADMKVDGTNDYYIYEFDDLSRRINETYNQFIVKPKRDGGKRKEVSFRWLNYRDFDETDKNRKNKWMILGFKDIA